MKLCLVLGIAMSVLLAPVASQANPECNRILQQILKNFVGTEDSLLAEFDPTKITNVELLGSHGNVFKLTMGPNSRKFVARVDDDFAIVAREEFSVFFARSSPLKSTPKVSMVPDDQLTELKKILKAKNPHKSVGIEKTKHISLSVFYENAKSGESYIHEFMTKASIDLV